MAYALSCETFRSQRVSKPDAAFPSDGKTIAELRELYRAAESRAARLRLLSVSGRELAEVDPDNLKTVLARCAERLAFFIGHRAARLALAEESDGLPILAPGSEGRVVARLVIDDLASLDAIVNAEDRDAVRMQLELMGATIDRVEKERERSALLNALKEREKRLELLLEKVVTAQEEERRRVSHELHDGVAQTATALVRLMESSQGARPAEQDQADGIAPTDIARSLVAELRRVIAGLRPTLLDDLGLLPALQSLADALAAEGYSVSVTRCENDVRLAPIAETALFRVAQEAISNIRKHAGGQCPVTMEIKLENEAFSLVIADKGRGPSDATLAAGGRGGHNVGIDVMKERMAALGGMLDWRAGASGGVTVEARLPLKGGL